MDTALLLLALACGFVSITSAGKDRLNKLLDGSQIRLYPHGTDLLLLLHAEYPIESPSELTKIFVCSLTGGKTLPKNKKGSGNPQLVPIPATNSNSLSKLPLSVTWEEDSVVTHTYVYKIAASSGYVECADNIGAGLKAKDVLHFAGNPTSVVARYEVRTVSNLVEELNKNQSSPALIFVDPDTQSNPEVIVRFESSSPNLLVNLSQDAVDFAAARNWTVKYTRDSLFCPFVEEEGFQWPATRFGRQATPIIPCIDENGLLGPTRRCLGNFLDGAYWETFRRNQKCTKKPQIAPEILVSTRKETILELEDIEATVLAKLSNHSAAEVNLVSIALQRASSAAKNVNLQTFVNVIDAVLRIRKQGLKALTGTSGTSERILDATAQIFEHLESNSSSPIVKRHVSALSVHSNDSFSGFALFGNRTMKVYPSSEDVDPHGFQRAHTGVVLLDGTAMERIDFLVFGDDSLFKSKDLRRKAVGPVVGVQAASQERPQEILKILVAFRKESTDQTPRKCVSWIPGVDEDWHLTSPSCRKGTIDKNLHSHKMDVCLCHVPANVLTYISRVEEKEKPDLSRFLGDHWKMPRMELFYKKTSSDVYLNVYDRKALEITGPILGSVACSIQGDPLDSFPNGFDPRRTTVLQDVTPMPHTYIKDMAVVRVSYKGEGKLRCKDTLGLGVTSNQISLRSHSAVVVKFRKDSSQKIDKFMSEYAFKFADKNRMTMRMQRSISNNTQEVTLRFSQKFRSNHSDFYRNVTRLSKKLAKEYEWTLVHVRSTSRCFSVSEEGFQWPTTEKWFPTVPSNPCVDSEGIPSPSRRCVEDKDGGAYWEEVPRRPDPCSSPSERALRLRNITNRENKADAIEEASRLISDGPSLKSYEVSLLSGLLKDAADGETKLPNISSLATVVDHILETGKEVLYNADDTTGSSHLARESIEALLASADTSKPRIITRERFTVMTIPLDSGIRGFYQEKFTEPKQSIVFLRGNESIPNIMKKSPKIAAIVKAIKAKKGVMTSVVFHDDSLFGASDEGRTVRGSVVGLALHSHADGKISEYENPIEILIFFPREPGVEAPRSCQFLDSSKGGWSGIGCVLLPEDHSAEMDVCLCSHLTYFSLIRSSSRSLNDNREEVDENPFSLSPFVGIFISFNCLIAVVLLGFLCAKYREVGYKLSLLFSSSARERDGMEVELETLQSQENSSAQTNTYHKYSGAFQSWIESQSSFDPHLSGDGTKPFTTVETEASKSLSSFDESGSASSKSRSSQSIPSDYFSN